MLTVEVKVNGCPIGLVTAVNAQGSLDGTCQYECEVHTVGEGALRCMPFEVEHHRPEGWAVLVRKILERFEQETRHDPDRP